MKEDNTPPFFVLLPRAAREDTIHETANVEEKPDSSDQATLLDKFNEYRSCLLADFGYVNNRPADIESLLFLKPYFILKNQRVITEDVDRNGSQVKDGVLLLVSDRNVLFSSMDRIFLDRSANSKWYENYRKAHRAYHKEKVEDAALNRMLYTFISPRQTQIDKLGEEKASVLVQEILLAKQLLLSIWQQNKHVKTWLSTSSFQQSPAGAVSRL